LQGCGADTSSADNDKPAEGEPGPHKVLKPSTLATNPTLAKKAAINFNRVARDCQGIYLAQRLNGSSDEFRAVAFEQANKMKDIPEKVSREHIERVFPKDAAYHFINGQDTGFLRKGEVYCHIRLHLFDMPGKAQLDSMVEEVQSKVAHITQFLPENAYGFLEAKSKPELMKAMKEHWRLQDLTDKQFIELREMIIPLKEEQTRTALFAVSAFATGGCLKHYFEVTLQAEMCSLDIANERIHDEEIADVSEPEIGAEQGDEEKKGEKAEPKKKGEKAEPKKKGEKAA